MKKLLAILLALALACALLVPAYAEEVPAFDEQAVVVLQVEEELKPATWWMWLLTIPACILIIPVAWIVYMLLPLVPVIGLLLWGLGMEIMAFSPMFPIAFGLYIEMGILNPRGYSLLK